MSKLIKLKLAFEDLSILIGTNNIAKILASERNENATIIKMIGSTLDEVLVEGTPEEIEALILRDQFAMSAMSGLLNSQWSDSLVKDVRMAYDIADEMLKAREIK